MEENETSYKKVIIEPGKKSTGFGKSVLIPFASGIIGASLVIGTCFGVPNIREKLFVGTRLNSNFNNYFKWNQYWKYKLNFII